MYGGVSRTGGGDGARLDPAGNWKKTVTDALGNLVQVEEPAPAGGIYYTMGARTESRTPSLLRRLLMLRSEQDRPLGDAGLIMEQLGAATPGELSVIAFDSERPESERCMACLAMRDLRVKDTRAIVGLLDCLLSGKPDLVWTAATALAFLKPGRYWRRIVAIVEADPRGMAADPAIYVLSYMRGARIAAILAKFALDDRLSTRGRSLDVRGGCQP